MVVKPSQDYFVICFCGPDGAQHSIALLVVVVIYFSID